MYRKNAFIGMSVFFLPLVVNAQNIAGVANPAQVQGKMNPQAMQGPALRQSRAVQLARHYAQTNHLPTRTAVCGPACRRVRRLLVPVTAQTFNSFFQHFNETKGFGAIRYVQNYNPHVALNLKVDANGSPADCYLWGVNYNADGNFPNGYGRGDYRNWYMTPEYGGCIVAVDLNGGPLKHMQEYFQRNEQTGNRDYPENCMMWLSNAPTGANTTLFKTLGLHRSKTAQEITAKLVHAANNRVEVIGVRTDDINSFKQMDINNLLGPVPHQGVEKAFVP